LLNIGAVSLCGVPTAEACSQLPLLSEAATQHCWCLQCSLLRTWPLCDVCGAAGATLKLRLLKKGKPLPVPAAAAGGAAAPAPAEADSKGKRRSRVSTASTAAADGSSSSSEADQGWHVFKAESGLKEYVLW
jgi:hypothetical protein